MKTTALVPYGETHFNIADLLPMPPNMGPPLPRFLGIKWPWLQGGGEGLSLPALPRMRNFLSSPETELTTYENIEEIELQDIDPELLMPRRIIVHRKSKRLE